MVNLQRIRVCYISPAHEKFRELGGVVTKHTDQTNKKQVSVI